MSWKTHKRRAVYLLARAVLFGWSLVPLPLALFFGRVLGLLAWLADGPDRRRAIEQSSAALGLDRAAARRLVFRLFQHLGLLAAELAKARTIRRRFESYVEFPVEDQARLRAALAEGKGVVGVTAHLGNWELLAQRVAHSGSPISTLARHHPNPELGALIVRWRGEGGVSTIDRGEAGGGFRILRSLRRGDLLAALIDQDTKVPSVFVPFFGRPAKTPSGPAQLALRAGTPVIAGFITRTAHGHRMSIERLSTEGLEGETEEQRIVALTARMSAAIEAAIQRNPEQWVWFHRRWKSQP